MAKYTLLVIALFTVVGCRQQAQVVERLPQPNFNGPIVAAPAVTPRPLPNVVQAPPARPMQPATGPMAWKPAVPGRSWRWIVIHHSATPAGSAAVFDKMHKQKGWDELGYHFVIGNGTNSGDGAVEVGPRWSAQKWGAHSKTADNRYNDYGIGICLVGNFDIERPTAAQMAALARLTGYLMQAYNVPADRIIGHGDTKATDCPGRNLSIAQLRQQAQRLAGASATEPQAITAAGGTLLRVTPP
jgi:hypothetical protein